MTLHPQVADRLDQIDHIVLETQEPGVRIIDKTGPLANPADRDHCIQYMVAIPLIFGRLGAEDYEDAVASDPRVDQLRSKMRVQENTTFTQEYYATEKRYIGNAIQVFFRDGTSTARVAVDYPIGHRKRRAEGIPVLKRKFETSVATHFPAKQTESIKAPFCRSREARTAVGTGVCSWARKELSSHGSSTKSVARIGPAHAAGVFNASVFFERCSSVIAPRVMIC